MKKIYGNIHGKILMAVEVNIKAKWCTKMQESVGSNYTLYLTVRGKIRIPIGNTVVMLKRNVDIINIRRNTVSLNEKYKF